MQAWTIPGSDPNETPDLLSLKNPLCGGVGALSLMGRSHAILGTCGGLQEFSPVVLGFEGIAAVCDTRSALEGPRSSTTLDELRSCRYPRVSQTQTRS